MASLDPDNIAELVVQYAFLRSAVRRFFDAWPNDDPAIEQAMNDMREALDDHG